MRACFDATSQIRWARPQSHLKEMEHAGVSAANSSGDLERLREPTYILTALVSRILGALGAPKTTMGAIGSRRWCLLAALALTTAVGCDRSTPATKPTTDPSEKPKAPCFADDLGTLTEGWTTPPECKDDGDSIACSVSCEKGDANACFNRAITVQRTSKAKEQTADLFKRACKLGLAMACTNWAAGVWRSRSDASSLGCVARVFEKSCAVKDQFGCAMVGRLLIEEGKQTDDITHGRTILEDSCDDLRGPPCRLLAWFLERGTFGPPDPSRMKDLLQRACDGGDELGCGEHKTVDETFH